MPEDPTFNVYRDQLSSWSNGLAIWFPDPPTTRYYTHSTPKKIYYKVSIGDVGYLYQGSFVRVFNVILPWNDELNKRLRYPEYFESLDCNLSDNIKRSYFDRVECYSRSVSAETMADKPDDVECVTYKFRGHGALLSLPNGGYHEDVIRTKAFIHYIDDHISSWFTWAQKAGLGVERMEDLILVTGCTFVTSWATATSVDNNKEAKISLESRVLSNSGASFVWSNLQGPVVYHNSLFDPGNPPTTPDQCMFIRGLRAKPARFCFLKTLNIMRAAAEPIPDNRRDDGIRVPGVPNIGSLLDELCEKGIYRPRKEGEGRLDSGEKGKREKGLKGMRGLKGHISSRIPLLLQGFLYEKQATYA